MLFFRGEFVVKSVTDKAPDPGADVDIALIAEAVDTGAEFGVDSDAEESFFHRAPDTTTIHYKKPFVATEGSVVYFHLKISKPAYLLGPRSA